jgi:aryl-alcohol dehydrogenase-like predicted oxidoreductase
MRRMRGDSSKIRIADMTVNRLGFGAMRVIDNEDIWGEPSDRKHAIAVLRRAVELGVELFDTAESYGPHTDETLIAEALHPYPKGLVVATKCGLSRPRPSRWDADCRPEKLRKDLEGSLKRLRVERIDLYQLHTVDSKVPFEVSVGTLADMQREGKVRHVGLSNVTVEQLEAARKIVPIVSVQNRYSLADRGCESVLVHCEKHGIAFLPWYPLGDGSALRLSKVKKLAEKLRATPAQVAIAWLLKKSPVMLPIPGTGNLEHLEENMAAAKLDLSDENFRSL